METIILVVHLIIALTIIGLVLIQRSSGGGLGLGGGNGGMGDIATARGTANALTRLTTYFAIAFFATSLTLGYMAANQGDDGVLNAFENAVNAEIATESPLENENVDAPQVPVE